MVSHPEKIRSGLTFKGFTAGGGLDEGDGGTLGTANPNSSGLIAQFNVNVPMRS